MKQIEKSKLLELNGGIKWNEFIDGFCDGLGFGITLSSPVTSARALATVVAKSGGVSMGFSTWGGLAGFF